LQLWDVKILDTFTKRLMTLTLNLPLELERYIVQEAKQQGISIESVTLQLLTSSMLLKLKQAEAVSLIQSWIDDEDIEEQQETGQYLIRALDEDRLSERKLFPVEMKGVTW
jgi:Tfp pilus assembly PilM family ATPase